MHGLLPVGRVVRPHGIRGEMVVDSAGDSLFRLRQGEQVWLGEPPVAHRVDGVRPHQGRVLLTVENVADRDAAEALRGAAVWLRPEQRSDLGEDEVWVDEIVGAVLRNPAGDTLGRVVGVVEAPAQDLLQVRTAAGEALVPMVRAWLHGWHPERGELVMDLPPGLLPAGETED